MGRKVMCVLLLLLGASPVLAQNISIDPNKKYYTMGETFTITIRWNGTDTRYFISLGPHLRVIGAEYRTEQRITITPVNRNNITGTVTRVDPNQTWIIKVDTWNASSIFTPSYYDIGFVNMTTAQFETKIHKDIIIVDLNMLLSDYNTIKGELQDMKNKEVNYQNMIKYLQGQLDEAREGMEVYKFMSEYSRTFNKYFDYVKFVNKSVSELVPMAAIHMVITVPVWYDPYTENWVSVRAEDIMIENGILVVKVPWRVEYYGNRSWVTVDSLMDPKDYFNQLLWNEWFTKRQIDAKEKYKQLYSASWIVPFGVIGAIMLFFFVMGLVFYAILRKWKRDMMSRPVVPPL